MSIDFLPLKDSDKRTEYNTIPAYGVRWDRTDRNRIDRKGKVRRTGNTWTGKTGKAKAIDVFKIKQEEGLNPSTYLTHYGGFIL